MLDFMHGNSLFAVKSPLVSTSYQSFMNWKQSSLYISKGGQTCVLFYTALKNKHFILYLAVDASVYYSVHYVFCFFPDAAYLVLNGYFDWILN